MENFQILLDLIQKKGKNSKISFLHTYNDELLFRAFRHSSN